MTRLAQALPIALVPEQFLIASVWFFMVNHRSLNVFSIPLANFTQRMFFKISLACPLPFGTVSSLACRPCNFRVQWQMLTAILTAVNQLCTAGMSARCFRSVWHSLSSHEKGRSNGTPLIYIFLLRLYNNTKSMVTSR